MDAAEQKLEVIRKLLAKAECAATPHEAEAYNTKAAEMMARHGLDAAIVHATGTSKERDVIGTRVVAMTDPYSTEKANLVGGIASTMNCRTVRHLAWRSNRTDSVTIIGFEADLGRVELAFTSLLLQATAGVTAQRPPGWSGESTAAFRRTWLIGFTHEVVQRLNDAHRRAVATHDANHAGSSAALVLVDRRTQVDRAFNDAFGNLRTGRKRTLTGSGYAAGKEAGRRADIGSSRLGGEKRALDR